MGELTRMGPGYVPLIAGIVLAGLGLFLIVSSRGTESALPEIRLIPILAVFASLIFWALTIEWLGLIPSTLGLVMIASLAQDRPKPVSILVTAVILVVVSAGLFVYGLRMPIDLIGF
jgi:putative tricarboxylic transport membrane protein